MQIRTTKQTHSIDVDVGGTFTDGFFTVSGGAYRTAKALTTPYDLTECVLAVVEAGAAAFDQDISSFLRATSVFRLSTTLGTNTLLQLRGARVGLLVSRGADETAIKQAGLMSIVAPELLIPIKGKVGDDGGVIEPLDQVEILAAVRTLIGGGARTIVVSLQNAHINPQHEREVRAIVEQRYPRHYLRAVPLQLGSNVSDHLDDQVRLNTAALNAYLHDEVAGSLYKVENRLRALGLSRPLLVVRGSGECARIAKTVAVETLNSGPVAAAFGAGSLSQILGGELAVTFDMGGTSLDVAVIGREGPKRINSPTVAGLELGIPMIEVESIGAGGGSVAAVLDGVLRVGPESVGSSPGPASFAKGGSLATVTDADVVLGLIDPDFFLGGRMKLDAGRAETAIDSNVASRLEISIADAACAIRETIETEMAAELRQRLSTQSASLRDRATLLACGGAGGLHACAAAALAGIRSVAMFPYGPVFSAFGSSTMDVVHSYRQRGTAATAIEIIDSLLERVTLDMAAEGIRPDEFSVHYTICADEADSVERALAHGLIEPGSSASDLRMTDAVGEAKALTVELQASAGIFHWQPQSAPGQRHQPETKAWRQVKWAAGEEPSRTPVFRLESLRPGGVVQGPAIIEASDTNLVVPINWQAEVDDFGNVIAKW